MKTLKEKLKAIYHIILDKEYIVFTVTVKDKKHKARVALISDNASNVFIRAAIGVLNRNITIK